MALTSSFPSRVSFGGGKRWAARAHLAAQLVLAAYALFIANLIVYRHPYRMPFGKDETTMLSRGTREKLALVKEPIRIVIPRVEAQDNPEHAAYLRVLQRARLLLEDYMAAQPLIRVEAEVDIFREPDHWVKVRNQYDLSQAQVNRMIFITGKSNEFRQTVTPLDLASFTTSRDPRVEPPRIAFRGEKAITDAITRLILRERKRVYFTQDHEELALSQAGAGEKAPAALNAARRELETEGYEALPLSLGSGGGIPADAKVVVIAGGFREFSRADLDSIDAYLRAGGKLLVALGPRRTGIEDLLEDWGVEVLEGKINYRMSIPGSGSITASSFVPAKRFHSVHPITAIFQDVPRFDLRYLEPRPVTGHPGARFLEATPLLETGTADRNEAFLLVGTGGAPRAGDFQLALAVEQVPPVRAPPAFRRLESRIVVIGAAGFLEDGKFHTGSHRDFFLSALAWLVGDEPHAGGGRALEERVLKLDGPIGRFLFWFPVVILPGFFLALGGLTWWLRRV